MLSVVNIPANYAVLSMMKIASKCRGVSLDPCSAGLNLFGALTRHCSSRSSDPCCSCQFGADGAAQLQSETPAWAVLDMSIVAAALSVFLIQRFSAQCFFLGLNGSGDQS